MTHPDTKPEALRLAQSITQSGQFTPLPDLDAAAAELRRLHAECESLRTQLQEQALQSLSTMGQDDATIADLRTQLAEALKGRDAYTEAAKRADDDAIRWATEGVQQIIAERDEARAELAELRESMEYRKERAAQREQRLWQWAHEELSEPLKTRYFSIVANGTADVMESPVYAQQFNMMKYRAERAESERDTARAEAEALRADVRRYRWLRDVAQGNDWEHIGNSYPPENTDAAIDTAMGAMKEGE